MTINDYFNITARKPVACATYSGNAIGKQLIPVLCKKNGIRPVLTYSTRFFPEMVILEKQPHIIWDDAYWDVSSNILANMMAIHEKKIGHDEDINFLENAIYSDLMKFLSIYFYDEIKVSIEFANMFRESATRPPNEGFSNDFDENFKEMMKVFDAYTQIYCFFHEKCHIKLHADLELYKSIKKEFLAVQEFLSTLDIIDIGFDEIHDPKEYVSTCKANMLKHENKHFFDELLCDYYAFIDSGEFICGFDEKCNRAEIYTHLMESIEYINTLNHNLNVLSSYIKLLLNKTKTTKWNKAVTDINEKNMFRFRYLKYSHLVVVTALSKRTGISHFNPDHYFFSNNQSVKNLLKDITVGIINEYSDVNIFNINYLFNVEKARDFVLAR